MTDDLARELLAELRALREEMARQRVRLSKEVGPEAPPSFLDAVVAMPARAPPS